MKTKRALLQKVQLGWRAFFRGVGLVVFVLGEVVGKVRGGGGRVEPRNRLRRHYTCLSGGARGWQRGWPPTDIVHGDHIELVLGVRTKRPNDVEHCNDATDFAERLWKKTEKRKICY